MSLTGYCPQCHGRAIRPLTTSLHTPTRLTKPAPHPQSLASTPKSAHQPCSFPLLISPCVNMTPRPGHATTNATAMRAQPLSLRQQRGLEIPPQLNKTRLTHRLATFPLRVQIATIHLPRLLRPRTNVAKSGRMRRFALPGALVLANLLANLRRGRLWPRTRNKRHVILLHKRHVMAWYPHHSDSRGMGGRNGRPRNVSG